MRYVGTKDSSDEFSTQADVGKVYVSPSELAGTADGHMWYDDDDVDVDGSAASSVLISAGLGLTGGGDLTANRTLAVDFSASGTSSATKAVRADDVRLLSNVTRVVYTGASPARPTGAVYVEWVGPALPTAGFVAGDTYVSTV